MAGVGAIVESGRKSGRGMLFLLGADLAYTLYSGTNSSPQTTDVFGDPTRLQTLWKYVRIGGVGTLFYVTIASVLERSWWPLIGGLTAAGFMHGLYGHAAKEARKRTAAGGSTAGTIRPAGAGQAFGGAARARMG